MRSALVVVLLLTSTAYAARKPNIIVIVGDDMGYADIGVHGCKDIPTPHIDSLAKNGVRCTNGYVSGPYCSPTRAGLLTGRYQQRFGHEFNPGGDAEGKDAVKGLSLKETTFPDRMKTAGYRTAMVGKWHLGGKPEYVPNSRGFDSYFGFLGGAHPYLPGKNLAPFYRNRDVVEENDYLTDAFGREAVAVIDKFKAEPFFLYYAFNAVHTPLQATEKYRKRFPDIKDNRRQTYAAMMSAMDDAIGLLLKKLTDEKLTDDTLIVFISDNGGPPVNASNNGALRGHKAQTWEGGIRVPFLVQWTGHVPAGKTYDQPVIQLDFLPTALAAAGAEVKPEWKLDGVNLLPFLKGESTAMPHEMLYWRFGKQIALRKGDWKLCKAAGMANVTAGAGVSSTEHAQLFNLKDDIGEATNLAEKHPDKVRELAAAWDAWNTTLAPPSWAPPVRPKMKAIDDDE